MVEFEREYRFRNNCSGYVARAKTYGTDTGYGNDTSLEIKLESDRWQYVEPLLYDIRYAGIWTAEEVDEFVRRELVEKFQARFE